MKMIVICLLGAAVLAFGYERFVQPALDSALGVGEWQSFAITTGAVFVGALFGWVAKTKPGKKPA